MHCSPSTKSIWLDIRHLDIRSFFLTKDISLYVGEKDLLQKFAKCILKFGCGFFLTDFKLGYNPIALTFYRR